ncbi:P-loop containing nucleoside triphosphate hydrolase protein [Endogone sp. FLAS-F59071]|nr:P-loop containing nucleoside triphosphate hydrolase protein [Endogone sp. FLAS-F59071]|eukprot:RUS17271.1 P-loop containing nucleoside triphosphate hydrolase protein [Endogone sp. FLAS-F59071]
MADLESLLKQAEQELSLDSGTSARYLSPTVLRRIDHILQVYASGKSNLPFEELIKGLLERVKDRIRFEIQWTSIPTISTTPIRRPLLVTGLFRSGTTLLYNLLNADPASRAHAIWELFTIPVPPSHPNDDDPRKLAFDEFLKGYNLHHIHPVRIDAPEEGIILFGHFDFFELSWRILNINSWNSPNMLGDGTTVDMHEMYQFYRRYLQTLGSVSPPGSHWIMKDPCDLWYLREFFDIFPDANVVVLNRPLIEVTPSSLSMFWNLEVGARQWNSCTKETLGPHHLKVQMEGLQNSARVVSEMQAAGRGQQVMELEYTDLVNDPIGAVDRIYKQFGYTSSPEMREGMRNWLNENPQGKHGKHEYSLAEWGLSEQDIASATQQLKGVQAQLQSKTNVSYG